MLTLKPASSSSLDVIAQGDDRAVEQSRAARSSGGLAALARGHGKLSPPFAAAQPTG
jgi:hypothetical protein